MSGLFLLHASLSEAYYQARRSLFGYFVRRCIVSCSKLSFEATRNLWHEFQMWSTGHLDDNAYHVRKDLISHSTYADIL